eukprot:Nk52_evm9s230 gene=Nk52_evmTU9s230
MDDIAKANAREELINGASGDTEWCELSTLGGKQSNISGAEAESAKSLPHGASGETSGSAREALLRKSERYNKSLQHIPKGSIVIPLAGDNEEAEEGDGPIFVNCGNAGLNSSVYGKQQREGASGNAGKKSSNSDKSVPLEDLSKFMLFFVKMKFVVVSGFGLFADLYDLAVIDLVKNIMAEDYSRDTEDVSVVTTAALAGSFVGTIFFGCLADRFGRRKMCIMTTLLMVIGAIGSALSYPVGDMNIYYTMSIWRFILGVGIGGEYPLSALLANEMVHAKESGFSLNTACSMMVWGTIVAPIVIWCCLWSGASYAFTWRFAVAFGAVPAAIAFYLRWRMCETSRFISDQKRRKSEAVLYVKTSYVDAANNLLRSYWRPLGASCISWFMYMIVSYGLGLFNGTITKTMGLGDSINDQTENVLFVNLMALPGTFVGLFCMDYIGRKNLQMIGFGGLSVLYVVIAASYYEMKDSASTALLLLYGLTKSFEQCALFSIYAAAAEMFPTRIRGICHGIASAAGVAGAMVGSSSFQPLLDSIGLRDIFYLCSALTFCAFMMTLFFVPYYNSEMLLEMSDLDDDRILSVLYPLRYSEKENPVTPNENVCPDTPDTPPSPAALPTSGSNLSLTSLGRQNSGGAAAGSNGRPLSIFKTKVTEGHLHRMNSSGNLAAAARLASLNMSQHSLDRQELGRTHSRPESYYAHSNSSRPASSDSLLQQAHLRNLSKDDLKQLSHTSTHE